MIFKAIFYMGISLIILIIVWTLIEDKKGGTKK